MKNKKAIVTVSVLGGVLLVLLIVGAIFAGSYNSLTTSKNGVDQAWSKVETQYQRRLDLIDNLVASVKGSQLQEQKVFGDLAQARSQYAGSRSADDQAKSASSTESALSRLLVITENYPDLKSSANIQSLIGELSKTENGVASARDKYNDTVTRYNIQTQRFPSNLFANMYGFKERTLFKADSGANKVPRVQFGS